MNFRLIIIINFLCFLNCKPQTRTVKRGEQNTQNIENVSGAKSNKERAGVFPSPFGPAEIKYTVQDGRAFINGDMMFSLSSIAPPSEGFGAFAVGSTSFLWPEGKIPYLILDAEYPSKICNWQNEEEFKRSFRRNAKLWEKSGFKFEAQSKDNFHPHTVFVSISPDTVGGWAHVGRQQPYFGKEAYQWLVLGKGCCKSSCIAHEMGHTIGLWHEQARPDRDRYVNIIWRNIDESKKHNFGKMGISTFQSTSLTPYDFNSIMHYDSYVWTVNNQPTVVKKDGSQIAVNDIPSELDISGAKKLYEKSKSVFISADDLTISDISLHEAGIAKKIVFKSGNGISYINFKISSEEGAIFENTEIYEGTTFEESVSLPYLDVDKTFTITLTPCTMREVAVSLELCGKYFEYSFSVNSNEDDKELVQQINLLENSKQALIASAITSLENFVEELRTCHIAQEEGDYKEVVANIGYATDFLLTTLENNNIELNQSIIDSILQFGLYRVNDPVAQYSSSALSLTLSLPKWRKKSGVPATGPIKRPNVPVKKPIPKKPKTKKEILIDGAGKVVIVAGVVGLFNVFILDQFFVSSTPYSSDKAFEAGEECSKLANAKDNFQRKIKEIALDLGEIEEEIASLSK